MCVFVFPTALFHAPGAGCVLAEGGDLLPHGGTAGLAVSHTCPHCLPREGS